MDEKMELLQENELNEVAGGANNASKKHAKIVNCKSRVNVRSTPDSSSDDNKIGYANLGDSYLFYKWSGNWAQVQYGSRKAYIYKDFVKIV